MNHKKELLRGLWVGLQSDLSKILKGSRARLHRDSVGQYSFALSTIHTRNKAILSVLWFRV